MSHKQNDIWNESQHELNEEQMTHIDNSKHYIQETENPFSSILKKSMSHKMVVSKPALLKEHKHLLKVLKSGKGRKQEFNKQKKEIKEYK